MALHGSVLRTHTVQNFVAEMIGPAHGARCFQHRSQLCAASFGLWMQRLMILGTVMGIGCFGAFW
jgi:hypothetical protein